MQYLPAIILGLLILGIITRPFTVLFHELGHAIPAILLTKKGATIFVGSYGDKKHSFKITIGGLDIWFRYNPLKWAGGLCIPKAEDISLNKIAVYTLCGPLLSLFFASCIFYYTFSYDLHGFIKLICAFALGSTILDLFYNLIPHRIKMTDGSVLFSDGHYLLNLQKYKRFPDDYSKAVDIYNRKEYERASKIFDDFINIGLVNEDVYRYAATSNIFIKNYEKAYEIQKSFEDKYELNSDDFYNLGLTSSFLNLEAEKTEYYHKSLEKNQNNAYTLNAIGYELNKKGEFQKAILFLNKAIETEPNFAYAYNNRGHSKIETGQLDEGFNDIQHSLKLDGENAYVYRNLGIYHLKRNEISTALRYFFQSKQIDNDTDLIDELINQAQALA